MQRICVTALIFLLMSLCTLNAEAAQNQSLTDEFIAATLSDPNLQQALQLLINKGIPVQTIIKAAKKAGHSDDAITTALYESLPYDQAILHSMQSPMSSDTVLTSLAKQGVTSFNVLGALIRNNADTKSVIATCGYMLKHDKYTKLQMMKNLMHADADWNLINKVAAEFRIQEANVALAYNEAYFERHGSVSVYTRSSSPQPALHIIGLTHINSAGNNPNAPPISPSKP